MADDILKVNGNADEKPLLESTGITINHEKENKQQPEKITGELSPWSATCTILNGSLNNGEFTILGTDSQILQVFLRNDGTELISEPGAMIYRSKGITMKTSAGGFGQGFKRCLGGESFFKNTYKNGGINEVESITLSPDYPAKIIPIDLNKTGDLHLTKNAYLAHSGAKISTKFKFLMNCCIGCCGGNGFFFYKN